jgi:hypothetical protein
MGYDMIAKLFSSPPPKKVPLEAGAPPNLLMLKSIKIYSRVAAFR